MVTLHESYSEVTLLDDLRGKRRKREGKRGRDWWGGKGTVREGEEKIRSRLVIG